MRPQSTAANPDNKRDTLGRERHVSAQQGGGGLQSSALLAGMYFHCSRINLCPFGEGSTVCAWLLLLSAVAAVLVAPGNSVHNKGMVEDGLKCFHGETKHCM